MEQSPLILLVDDDPEVRTSVRLHLEADGFRVCAAADIAQALELAAAHLPHLAIVDLLLPGGHGFDLARRLRELADIPILVLSALGDEETRVLGLERYADDFLAKPFSQRELAARVRALLRRTWGRTRLLASAHQLEPGLAVDLGQRTIWKDGRAEHLTPTECRLLHLLMANAGRVLPTELLLDRVWPDGQGEATYLWEYVRRLRDKLGDDAAQPRYLQSERGVGYRFCLPAASGDAGTPRRRDAGTRRHGEGEAQGELPVALAADPGAAG
ncbi:MAG: response regulator transcription factor [Chloroflexi bacterium]|nr:response regulator transcription factor [Chloroflexota bacterium]